MAIVKLGDTVDINYAGALMDGTAFNTAQDNLAPLRLTIGAATVIPGWTPATLTQIGNEALGMQVDAKKTVNIPLTMAYGVHTMNNITELKILQIVSSSP